MFPSTLYALISLICFESGISFFSSSRIANSFTSFNSSFSAKHRINFHVSTSASYNEHFLGTKLLVARLKIYELHKRMGCKKPSEVSQNSSAVISCNKIGESVVPCLLWPGDAGLSFVPNMGDSRAKKYPVTRKKDVACLREPCQIVRVEERCSRSHGDPRQEGNFWGVFWWAFHSGKFTKQRSKNVRNTVFTN